MLLNPELRRYFWLDFTIQRMLLAPIIITLLIYIFHLMNHSSSETAFYLACFFIFLWGIKNASETVIEEISDHTWDFQRQSSLLPVEMTLGKLFGSTLYSWYGAIISLIFYIALSNAPLTLIMRDVSILMMGGIFGQSIAILASLQVVPQIRYSHTRKTFRYFVVGLVLGGIATLITFKQQGSISDTRWFHISFASDRFALISLFLFTMWSIFGLYRAFRTELQYPQLPIGWLAFNFFCVIYFAGLTSFLPSLIHKLSVDVPFFSILLRKSPLYTAFFIAQTLTYVCLVTEILHSVRYRKIIKRWKTGLYLESIQKIPLWIISFFIMLGIFAILACSFSSLSERFLEQFSPSILFSTLTLFTLRDILILHYFSFSKNTQRIVGAFTCYLFLLYFLIPSLLSLLALSKFNVIFLPSWGQDPFLAFTGIIVQLVVVTWLCYKRY